MLNLPPSCRIWWVSAATDMRRGFDGLLAEARRRHPDDALSGHLFVFVGRRRNMVKVLWWSPGGLSLLCKRLEAGRFRLPTTLDGQASVAIGAADLAMLLEGIDWTSVKRQPLFQPHRSVA